MSGYRIAETGYRKADTGYRRANSGGRKDERQPLERLVLLASRMSLASGPVERASGTDGEIRKAGMPFRRAAAYSGNGSPAIGDPTFNCQETGRAL